jgi:hypothetical protein
MSKMVQEKNREGSYHVLPVPMEASDAAVSYVRFTSIRATRSLATNGRSGSRPKSELDIAGPPMRLLSMMAMSMLLRQLDATITVHEFRSSFRDWAAEAGVEYSVADQCLAHAIGSDVNRSYLRTSDPFSRRGRHLSATRPATTWSTFAGPGRDPSREFSKDMEGGMTTLVLTNVDAAKNMAIAAGKGAKAQKIGLKEQASPGPAHSNSASWQIAVGVTAARRRGAGETVPQASRASLPPVPVPTPSGEERAADAPSSTTPPRFGRAS